MCANRRFRSDCASLSLIRLFTGHISSTCSDIRKLLTLWSEGYLIYFGTGKQFEHACMWNNCIAKCIHCMFLLDKFQVLEILRIQIIDIDRKKESNVQKRNKNVYYPMYMCNYEAKSDTGAFFFFLHSRQRTVVHCLTPILKFRMQTVFQVHLLPHFNVMYQKVHRHGLTPISDPIRPQR